MANKLFVCLITIIIINVKLTMISAQNDLFSPCPLLFKYKTRSDSYQYGVLTVPSPPLDETSVTVIALFTLRSRLPTVSIIECKLLSVLKPLFHFVCIRNMVD